MDRADISATLRSDGYVISHIGSGVADGRPPDRTDNLVSVLVAIGSPALAGYSLAITRLNSRWLSRQFLYLHYSNRVNIPQAISALQHIPFTINTSGSFLPSLIILHQNDRYWKLLAVAAKRTRQWSIPVAMNILWALVALFFTIVDSLVDFDTFYTLPGDAGYSIVAVWTYLLPLVIGWLHVGSQLEAGHLRDALDDAHEMAYVATASEPILATRITGRSTRAIEPSTRHIDHVNADEKKSAPVFNYSRVFIWSQHAEYILRLYEHAATNVEKKIPVQHGAIWKSEDIDTIEAHDRIGNEVEVMRYCAEELEATVNPSPRHNFPPFPTPLVHGLPFPVSPEPSTPATLVSNGSYQNTDYFPYRTVPGTPSKYDEEALPAEPRAASQIPVFATEVLQRVAFAALLGLGLQWGTTGAAILIHMKTPPEGFGCRALTYIAYGAAGTAVFLLLLFSSILSHLARRQNVREKRSVLKTIAGYLAVLTRWLGKFIGIMNGLGILVSCAMQFAGVYDNCFCSSGVFSGTTDGLVSFTPPDVQESELYGYWIGGVVMAFVMSGLYSFAIFVATPM